MYKFRYDYLKPKYDQNAKLHCLCKTDDIYKDFAEDVEKIFATSNYEIGRPVPKGKNKKVI